MRCQCGKVMNDLPDAGATAVVLSLANGLNGGGGEWLSGRLGVTVKSTRFETNCFCSADKGANGGTTPISVAKQTTGRGEREKEIEPSMRALLTNQ